MQLNPEQQEAVESDHQNTLVVAGPGTGKTRVLVHRIDYIAEQAPGGIVAITYTNAAAREIQERVNAMREHPVKLGFIGTIHGYALKLLRAHGAHLGLPERVSVMDEEQADELLEMVACDLHVKESKKALQTAVRVKLDNLSGVSASTRPDHLSGAQLVAYEYFARMLEHGALSFDAIIAFACVVAPRAKDVTELLVDEYQDCSDAVHLLCQAVPGRKFIVGDPDQAIYGFAGGNVRNIIDVSRMEDFHTIILRRNYRSAKSICTAAERLIVKNRLRVSKGIDCQTASNGMVEALEPLETPGIEFARVGTMLAPLAENGSTLSVAVLARSNAIVADAATVLQSMGIRVRKKQRSEKPRDWMVARRFIALAANPENDMLAFWFIALTRGAKQAAKIRLDAATEAKSLNGHYLKMPDNIDLGQIPDILGRIGVGPESIDLVKKATAGLLPEEGIAELAIALGNAELHTTETGDGIHVTTMHAAKGREWDWVFIVGADDEVIPGNRANVDIEEERRLMFVAVTRARERLVITTARERKAGQWMKRPEPATPSRFIAEMALV